MRPNRSIMLGAAALLCVSPLAAQSPLGTPIPNRPLGATVEAEGEMEVFLQHQLGFPRVSSAREMSDQRLRAAFQQKGLEYPAPELFLRVFKHERELEVWARSNPEDEFTLVRSYPVCALAGQLGPKRRMGDIQVPEGFYFIDEFNPRSDFHLSLRVSYPNMSDRLRRKALALGGDIFIHGGCETVGCVPIEDANIEELYWLAVQATDRGQRVIPVHIFPTRLGPDRLRWLEETFDPEPDLLAFWSNLQDGYRYFEETRRVPWVTVSETGDYAVPPRPRLAGEDDDATDQDRENGSTPRNDAPVDTAGPLAPAPTPPPVAPDSASARAPGSGR